LIHEIPIFDAPAVQIYSFWKNSIKWNKLKKYSKKSEKCTKFEHGVPGTVGGRHKKFGGQKIKKLFAECQDLTLGKLFFFIFFFKFLLCGVMVVCHCHTFPSAKLCRGTGAQQRIALPSVGHSQRSLLLSAWLRRARPSAKCLFVECLIFCAQQTSRHSAKSLFPVVMIRVVPKQCVKGEKPGEWRSLIKWKAGA
jgi:hypothetical protein